MKRINVLLLAAILLIPSLVFAHRQDNVTIQSILVDATTHSVTFYTSLPPDTSLCAGAQGATSVGVLETGRGASLDGIKSALSVLLAAKLSGKKTTIIASDTTFWGCTVTAVQIDE